MLTRRGVVAGGGLLLAGCAGAQELAGVRPRPPSSIKAVAGTAFKAIESRIGGRVGVCAIDTRSDVRIGHRQGERFAMASTFKWLLAAGILKRAEQGMNLEDHALYNRADLMSNSPVSEAHFDAATGMGRMTIAQMCEAIVVVSDNCAANLLLVPMFGPEGLTRFIREAGDSVTRLDRNEPTLNENAPGDVRDTTTPEAMAAMMARIVTTDQVLNAGSRAMLLGWLRKTSTGLDRLRAGLPVDWMPGDKTGTGGNGSHNDVAIAFPPGRKPIVIASYFSESKVENAAKAAAHAEVARIVVKEFG